MSIHLQTLASEKGLPGVLGIGDAIANAYN